MSAMRSLLIALLAVVVCTPGVLVAQAQTGVVTGQIRNPDGSPAAGIRVAVTEARDSNNTTAAPVLVSITQTDASGRYRLDRVPSGRYYIVAGLVEFPTYYPGVSDVKAAQ